MRNKFSAHDGKEALYRKSIQRIIRLEKKFEFQYMFKPISYKRRDMENKFRGLANKESFRGIGTKSELNYSSLKIL